MSVAAFDTYIVAKRLRDAGFDEHQAEALVSMVRDATADDRDQLATKADFATLKSDLTGLEDRFDAAIVALRADLATLRADTRADLTAAFASLERRLIGYGIALAGLLFAALKLF